MKAHWWSCVLGLLCLPAEVTLNTWLASQKPLSTSVTINSSAEITCYTKSPNPMGCYLKRHFHNTKEIVYLSIEQGKISKDTTAAEFQNRIEITPLKETEQGLEVTLSLSLLASEDTDVYYCSWTYFQSHSKSALESNGTIIIVKEKDPSEQCTSHFLDHILISLSVTAFAIMLAIVIVALILRCKRFKKHFRPRRPEIPHRPSRHEHVCHHQRAQPPYLVTSANTHGSGGIYTGLVEC